MSVFNYLGSGFLEAVYQDALEIEFIKRNIPFEREKKLPIIYEGQTLQHHYIADFFCYNNIIVETKAVKTLAEEHYAQVINYLKITNKQLGLLINFGSSSLQHKRIILTK